MSGAKPRNETGGENDPPGEDLAAFRSTLQQFKHDGCNLLVVGDSPRELFTRASETMLGDPDARRWRIFALTDASRESVHERLPSTTGTQYSLSETTKVIDHTVSNRPATDVGNSSTGTLPEVTVGDDDIDGLRTAVTEAVETFGERSHRPAQVRLAVDSVAPLLDNYDFEAVRTCFETVGCCVREHDAMAHYVLPEPFTSERCRRLADDFDAVVELRTHSKDADYAAEERWHLTETNVTMPWVPL